MNAEVRLGTIWGSFIQMWKGARDGPVCVVAQLTVHSDLAGTLRLASAVLGYTLVQTPVLGQCLLDGD